MKLSILDRSRTRAGVPDAAALTGTIDRAVHAEQLGFHRFWVAEHHGVPGIASGSPPVLLAAIGARTDRIRLGSGGVMLPNHQPLVVAEQFLMLEALYPRRIDLGVGRSLGFTRPVRDALRRDRTAPDTFADDLDELRRYLEGAAPVTARPRVEAAPPMFVLATRRGLDFAARAGLPVVVGGPILGATEGRIPELDRYRDEFVPSPGNREPYVMISLEVMIADSTAAARELLLSEAWALASSSRTGEFPALESVSVLRDRPWTQRMREQIDASIESSIHGTADEVREQLDSLFARTGADELLASTSTFDREALLDADRSLSLLYRE
ncbi:LLM class flavin-dependent oxidoreductase [Rhodococcus oxybenzonivorans]|uniref:LLM class flavin-dependent oxidoreductase n=1 Tax=Rhodococcus oxybenzonivorans TaxID=1990687 RepID=UPI0029529BEC|nr:LLM class flavin-dependent oxidoreductase [Rhodococcus oxybenzonivorans]MDV7354841.1 LLM class flavin-dependent oxidoreductase [Rhodococcus oxybenzonivorans]